MLKRIYATVAEKTFYDFRAKAQKEGLKMDEAFARLVEAYVKEKPKAPEKKKAFNYVEAKNNG